MSDLTFNIVFAVLFLALAWLLRQWKYLVRFGQSVPAGQGAPYFPTRRDQLGEFIAFAHVRRGERAVDIGSGDGRLLIALARAGVEAHGYEINHVLVWWSRLRILFAGLTGRAMVHRGDLWKQDFSTFDLVTVFGISAIMQRLEEKLRRELRPGARVVSRLFEFPTWPVSQRQGAYALYKQPSPPGQHASSSAG